METISSSPSLGGTSSEGHSIQSFLLGAPNNSGGPASAALQKIVLNAVGSVSDPKEAQTQATWRQCAEYEQEEVLLMLRKIFAMKSFQSDEVTVEDTQSTLMSIGMQEAEETDSLVLRGTASLSRTLMYHRVTQLVRQYCTDFTQRVQFALRTDDELPLVELEELLPTPPLQAKRLWQRAMWAMRCGILQKIGEARAMAAMQHKKSKTEHKHRSRTVSPSASPGRPDTELEDSPKESLVMTEGATSPEAAASQSSSTPTASGPKRSFAPLSKYHHSINSPSVDLRRFAFGSEAIFVVWATWDERSVEYLAEHLFPRRRTATDDTGASAPALHASESSHAFSTAPKSRRATVVAPTDAPHEPDDDPWLQFYQWTSAAPTRRRSRVDSLGRSSIFGSLFAEESPQEEPTADWSCSGAQEVSTPENASEQRHKSSPQPPSDTTVLPQSSGQRRNVTISASSFSSELPKQSTLSPLPPVSYSTTSAKLKSGRRRTAHSKRVSHTKRTVRSANIVLVSVDADKEAAMKEIEKLRQRVGYWSSPQVAMNFMWGGPEGLHSTFATMFRITSLPLVLAARRPGAPGPAGSSMASLQPPRIVSMKEPNAFRPKRKSVVSHLGEGANTLSASENALAQGGQPMLVPWHHINEVKRRRYIDTFQSFLKSCDAPLVFESCVSRQYAVHPTHIHVMSAGWSGRSSTASLPRGQESAGTFPDDKKITSEDSSTLTLKGSACVSAVRQLFPVLRELISSVSNFDFDVMLFEPSARLNMAINPRTAEHRVYGWAADVSCAACGRRVLIDQQWHYQCLACPLHEASLCSECVEADRHPRSHVLAKMHYHQAPFVDVIWGRSNVAVLPTMQGKLVTSRTNAHVGVYCNICFSPIVGVRYKCMQCHDVDMCTVCEGMWFEKVKAKKTDRRHNTEHIFMRIACAVPGDSSCFLIPQPIPLWSVMKGDGDHQKKNEGES